MASGPFAVLRDSGGTVVLAWGDHTLNARARSLGFTALVLAAEGIQDPLGRIRWGLVPVESHMLRPTMAGARLGRLQRELGIPVLRCGYLDSPNLEQAQAAAMRCGPQIADLVEAGERVLVTCAAGENRSALLAAYARHLLTGEPGSVIYADMERSGPQGFSNNVFRRWVLTWPQETGRQTTAAWTKGLAIVGGMVAGALLVRFLVPW